MKAAIVVLLIAAAFTGGYGYGRWYGKPSAAGQKKPERKILYWVDPMHPAYKSDKPGIAPDCGMKLVPVYADEAPAAEAPPPGSIHVSAEKQQLIGVRYGEAEYTSGSQAIRAVGKVAMDETLISHVHSRTGGWIEKVFVNFTGDVVRKGEPLLTIYSPDLLATQQEYLLALKARNALKGSTVRDVAGDSDALVAAARKRLELWDLTPAQIDEVAHSGEPVTNVTLYSPVSGYVLTRNAFGNQKITPDTDLYTVADLSRIWVLANVYEYQAPLVRMGQLARISLPYSGGRTYSARVSYIQPQVDPATRTLQVRLELPNPGLALKPDMFVDVQFDVPQQRLLTVPAEAVLDSGTAQTVFVDRGNGYFEPRAVETGQHAGDRVEILKGLEAGERVVTSGNFLIGSESQLKPAADGMRGMKHD
jgi:Cu(I)/Ag(I) efflux system membrane fusion protein